MAPPIHGPGAVRPGEELDVAAVDAWLKAQVPTLEGTPEVTQYSGGASNWTYRLKYANRDLDPAPAPGGHEGEVRARHGARVHGAAGAEAGLPGRAHHGRPVPGPLGDRLRLLRDGAHRGPHPAQAPASGLTLDTAQTRQLCLNVISTS